ncbi:MAG: hypothetical protein B6229_07530 [Spirochaetaceae bacterium 4572_7]|nr:MAG: hypothetical protein B6229_07530 [Spirochaetaceae bacterium 4572_7]
MDRNILKTISIIVIILSLTSCERLTEGATLISGNQKYRSGNYQGAIIDYLKGVESSANMNYFHYNLGNVYSSLGEYPAAFSVWSRATHITNPQLKYNLLFNIGFLKYKLGDYREAYELYRDALVLMPYKLEAKINLELCLSKMSAGTYSPKGEIPKKESDNSGVTDETTRILEYIRQKEAMTWGTEYQASGIENDW